MMVTSDDTALCADGKALPTVTRRSLLRAAPLAAVGLLPAAAVASAETPILRLFREWDASQAVWNDTSRMLAEAEEDASYATLTAMEEALQAEPLTCLVDLAAKLLVSTTYGDFEPDKALIAECEALLAGGAAWPTA